jgi:hypothetical protein
MKTFFKILARSLLVALVYAVALALSALLVSAFGLALPVVKDPLTKLLWTFVAGLIIGLTLGPIAASMPASPRRHLLVWGSLIFFNLASVAIEGSFFAPTLIGNALPALLIQQFLAAVATGWVITALFSAKEASVSAKQAGRSFFSWAWRFPVSVLVYVVFYFIFGGINYALVTRPYYQAHAGGLAVPAAQVTLMAELIRGALIALSVLPFLLTVHTSKKRRALQTGLLLFAIGGLVPLTMQVGVLPLALLAASAVEIFFQNFSTGVVVSRLLGRPE